MYDICGLKCLKYRLFARELVSGWIWNYKHAIHHENIDLFEEGI